jgi:hypothetical protein
MSESWHLAYQRRSSTRVMGNRFGVLDSTHPVRLVAESFSPGATFTPPRARLRRTRQVQICEETHHEPQRTVAWTVLPPPAA